MNLADSIFPTFSATVFLDNQSFVSMKQKENRNGCIVQRDSRTQVFC